MAFERILDIKELNRLGDIDESRADAMLKQQLDGFHDKLIVLDDDPTGVQTVHGVSVYTDWSEQSIYQGLMEERRLFFVLTNSRSFTSEKTEHAHREMARNIAAAAKRAGKGYVVISRSDSTLRGHYPLETATLADELKKITGKEIDGEVICPFFVESGRYTIGDVHYVAEGDKLTPAGQTEFARDKAFGYTSSDMREWCEEKTGGDYKKENVISVSIAQLRSLDVNGITSKLMGVQNFNKIVVNAASYNDLKVFAAALIMAMKAGKRFLFRSAAGLVKVLGGVSDRPLLKRDELIAGKDSHGGLVVVGSHVNRTTRQLAALLESGLVEPVQFNQHLVFDQAALKEEIHRVCKLASERIFSGGTVAVFTRRERVDLHGDSDQELNLTSMIADAVTEVVKTIVAQARPSFIVSKGGITSSDIGIKVLGVKKATVAGQIAPGVSVWKTGEESFYPGMPYVIFPGNVGGDGTLCDVVAELGKKKLGGLKIETCNRNNDGRSRGDRSGDRGQGSVPKGNLRQVPADNNRRPRGDRGRRQVYAQRVQAQ